LAFKACGLIEAGMRLFVPLGPQVVGSGKTFAVCFLVVGILSAW
jgi:hypothetical protein